MTLAGVYATGLAIPGSTTSIVLWVCNVHDSAVVSGVYFSTTCFWARESRCIEYFVDYIVLGVGVDDCYVFLDAFQQSRGDRLSKRLAQP